jgi:hypothetical protein
VSELPIWTADLLRLLAVYDRADCLSWNSDLEFAINCNDIFAWAVADCEPIETSEDVLALGLAFKDAGEEDGPILYCCRRRKMRPQGAVYKEGDKEHIARVNWPLFDACGPEREVGFGNPLPRPQ